MVIDSLTLQIRAANSTPAPHEYAHMSRDSLFAIIWIFAALAVFFAILRTWLQHSHNKRLYTNDILIGFATILHVVLSIAITCMAPLIYEAFNEASGSVLSSPLSPTLFNQYLKYQFAVLYLIWTALWTVKLAMLSFFWRLFISVKTNARIFWWFMCGITIITWIVSLILQAIACSPPSRSFHMATYLSPKSIKGFNRAFLFASCVDIITDFLIMLIPFPLLWKLQMPRRQKHVLIVIFLTPSGAIVFAVLRLTIQEGIKDGPTIDPVRLILYSTLEVSLSIIAASLPSMRLYFKDRSVASSTAGLSYLQRNTQRTGRVRVRDRIALQDIHNTTSRMNCSTRAILEPDSPRRELEEHPSNPEMVRPM